MIELTDVCYAYDGVPALRHVTAAAAGMTAISLMKGKKWIAPSVVWVLLMMMSRNYLMAHYPSDVLAAAIIGAASGFIAWMITKLIYKLLEEHAEIPLFAFILDFDLGNVLPLDNIKERIGGIVGKSADGERKERARGNAAKSVQRGGSHGKTEPAKRRAPSVGYKGKHEKK